MMEELVRMYEKGAITADHLAVESLHRLDPADPALVLKSLPREILLRMLGYADQYRPGAMRTNYGLQPAPDQVSAAKQWIEVNIVNANSGGISQAPQAPPTAPTACADSA